MFELIAGWEFCGLFCGWGGFAGFDKLVGVFWRVWVGFENEKLIFPNILMLIKEYNGYEMYAKWKDKYKKLLINLKNFINNKWIKLFITFNWIG